MKRTIKNDPLKPLLGEYYLLLKEAYRLEGLNQKMSRKKYNRASFLALEIQALRFRN
ncbi:hypothetical protein [Maribellus sediminis]|uniref:hypothetical protein n=1 Tax=Maribellus sediminis TaxID=2696285 RepID=UPI001430F0CD|nr:hypothetical protein [Maribellus sediminis]